MCGSGPMLASAEIAISKVTQILHLNEYFTQIIVIKLLLHPFNFSIEPVSARLVATTLCQQWVLV
jgi:hypothetical protein